MACEVPSCRGNRLSVVSETEQEKGYGFWNTAAGYFGPDANAFFSALNNAYETKDGDQFLALVNELLKFFRQEDIIDYDYLDRKGVWTILMDAGAQGGTPDIMRAVLYCFDAALCSNDKIADFLCEKQFGEFAISLINTFDPEQHPVDVIFVLTNILQNMCTDTAKMRDLYECDVLGAMHQVLVIATSSDEEDYVRCAKRVLLLLEKFLVKRDEQPPLATSVEINMILSELLTLVNPGRISLYTTVTRLFNVILTEDPLNVYRFASFQCDDSRFFTIIASSCFGLLSDDRMSAWSLCILASALDFMDSEKPIPYLIEEVGNLIPALFARLEATCDNITGYAVTLIHNYLVVAQTIPDGVTFANLVGIFRMMETEVFQVKKSWVIIVLLFLQHACIQPTDLEDIAEIIDMLFVIVPESSSLQKKFVPAIGRLLNQYGKGTEETEHYMNIMTNGLPEFITDLLNEEMKPELREELASIERLCKTI